MKILGDIAQEQDRKTIIFVETKRRADEIARTVNRRGFNALAIHGDKSQSERDYTLNSFRSGRMNVQILIATDVASRGLGEYFVPIIFLFSCCLNKQKFYQSHFLEAEISLFPLGPTERFVASGPIYFLFICRIFSRKICWENLLAINLID